MTTTSNSAPPKKNDTGVAWLNEGYAVLTNGTIVFWSKNLIDCEDYLNGISMRSTHAPE